MVIKMLLRVLAKLRLLQYLNLSVLYRKEGRKVWIPILNSHGLGNLELSELWMCEIFEKLTRLKTGNFVDIGVNLGQTLVKLKLTNDRIHYIGFDPNPVCIYYTQELIRRNRFDNAVLVPVGISKQTELIHLNFYAESGSDTSASIIKGFRPHKKVVRHEFVACFNYEWLKSEVLVGQTAIVKIDVEGAELDVLTGLREFLERRRPFILVEILPVYTPENRDRMQRQDDLVRLVNDLKYKIFRVRHSGGIFLNIQPIQVLGMNADGESSDYFLCPSEDVSRLTLLQSV